MWNLCLKLCFFRNHLSQRLKTYSIGFGMPRTINTHHSSHFMCIFPSQNQQNVKFMPEIVIFHEPLIVGTCNKCHWIWHTSNHKYCTTQAISMHFSQSKSTKCEIFAWYCDFLRNHLSQRHETCGIGFGIPQTLHMCYSSHFNPFFPVKINKCDILAVSWTLPDNKLKKKLQFAQGKSVCKGLQICTYRIFGYANCNALCYNFVWQVLSELLWFLCICYGKVKILGSETWCKGKMWPKEDCCICPIPFSWIWTPFAAMCLLKLWFFMNQLS